MHSIHTVKRRALVGKLTRDHYSEVARYGPSLARVRASVRLSRLVRLVRCHRAPARPLRASVRRPRRSVITRVSGDSDPPHLEYWN